MEVKQILSCLQTILFHSILSTKIGKELFNPFTPHEEELCILCHN